MYNDIKKYKNIRIRITLLLFMMFILMGCSNNEDSTQNKPTNKVDNEQTPTAEIIQPSVDTPTVTKQPDVVTPTQQATQPPINQSDPIKQQIDAMSLEEKIGQLVIVGLEGYSVDDNTKALIEDYHVGGFIFFNRNIENANQLLSLLNDLKTTNQSNNIPLFLSVDEEGGRVSRMPGEFLKLPTNQKIGEVNNSELSYEIGTILAKEVKEIGFNMDFAPVLDINSNPDNPVIGDRSFGADETIVSALGVQTMRGITEHGVIAVVKHFPGHGDTSVDSHLSLPMVNHDMKRLESFELIPFKEAIAADVDAVMVAHILMNQVDPEVPASLSKIVITDLLRNQLDFWGVIISDDMTMGAIKENYTIADAAIQSLNAGCDLLLVCHGYENEIAVLDSVKKAVLNGTIDESRIEESVYRILKLKEKYQLADDPISSMDIDTINQEIQDTLNKYIKE